mgnify:CR=1 FL=1
MKSLQQLVIKNGPLKELPPKMNELNDLSYLDFRFNQLTEFDVDVKKIFFEYFFVLFSHSYLLILQAILSIIITIF